jgi:hypothetical protein
MPNMAEGRSAVGPVILVFGCLGLLIVSLMVASVGGAMLAFREMSAPSTWLAVEASEPEPPANRTVIATVDSVRGAVPIQPGSECRFNVILVDDDRCRTAVWCGATVVYGGSDTNGYFPCTPSGLHVRGTDSETTSDDNDAALHIDTAAGILRVDDDGDGTHGELHLVATVLRVEPR